MKIKLISFLLCFSALFVICGVFASAESNIPRINDQMDVLTEAQEKELSALLEESYKKYEMQVMLLTLNEASFTIWDEDSAFSDAKSQADQYFMTTCGFVDSTNGVVLVFYDFGNYRGLYIAPFGELSDVYTEGKTDSVLDEIETYFKRGSVNAYEGFKEFISCNEEVWEKRNTPSMLTIIIALVIAFIIAFAIVSSMKGKLKTVRSQAYANEYLKSGSFKLNNSRDIFLYRNVVRVKIERNTSSGSGGGGGGSRGGGGRSL